MTGASKGIGSGIAAALGAAGVRVDIIPPTLFLASDESAWITGEVIRAAGGLVVAT
ncbi:MAG TPA: hypothetical protein VK794_00665 [Steroidobacteraceae bacterium]|jgi:NAD(P)-dependent dehydrogenase (short-subunit alcohol dehydrogenase family)|nr:hypothetical protein [Steroidobacteraceae bacterium]